jgi:peroxiredoxin
MRGAGVWAIAALVAVAAFIALFGGSSTPPPIGRGVAAPEFELPRVDGAALNSSSLDGKVVLLNFWATWCKPCEDEMPAMERLYTGLPRSEFELVAISVDDNSDLVAPFVERLGLTFPVLLDADQAVARRYQTFKFPESLLVGRDGVVVERYIGQKEWDADAYVARIRRLIDAPQ